MLCWHGQPNRTTPASYYGSDYHNPPHRATPLRWVGDPLKNDGAWVDEDDPHDGSEQGAFYVENTGGAEIDVILFRRTTATRARATPPAIPASISSANPTGGGARSSVSIASSRPARRCRVRPATRASMTTAWCMCIRASPARATPQAIGRRIGSRRRVVAVGRSGRSGSRSASSTFATPARMPRSRAARRRRSRSAASTRAARSDRIQDARGDQANGERQGRARASVEGLGAADVRQVQAGRGTVGCRQGGDGRSRWRARLPGDSTRATVRQIEGAHDGHSTTAR